MKTAANMGVNGTYSNMGGNYRLLMSKYGMNEINLKGCWYAKCINESIHFTGHRGKCFSIICNIC